MDALREYLLGVVAAALLCGILTKLVNGKSMVGVSVKLVGGFLLLLAVIRPWTDIQIDNFLRWTESISLDGEQYVAAGENAAMESYCAGIKQQIEAYIVDEARALNCELQAEVTLTSDKVPVPKSVRLYGEISPYARQAMTTILTEKLGIHREDIEWI